METIAVINQKGGVGKSTTAAALAAGLTLRGRSVLTIDLDSQCNLTTTANINSDYGSIEDVLLGRQCIDNIVWNTPYGGMVASSPGLAGADATITETGKEFRLKESLSMLRADYDYIIIDTPPALGILTVNALTAANRIVIPAQADAYSLDGINQLSDTIRVIRKYCNPALSVDGILLTRFNNRLLLSREILDKVSATAQSLDTKLFSTPIREAVAVREAQARKLSLYAYAPNAAVTMDYELVLSELENGKGGDKNV